MPPQAAAAISASLGKARLLGLVGDRREVGEPGAFDQFTDCELAEEAERRAAVLGATILPSYGAA